MFFVIRCMAVSLYFGVRKLRARRQNSFTLEYAEFDFRYYEEVLVVHRLQSGMLLAAFVTYTGYVFSVFCSYG